MENLHPNEEGLVSWQQRQEVWGYQSAVFWFTGLSGSGKSTVAQAVEHALFEQRLWPKMLDGDNIRTGIGNNLGFTENDRRENVRRIAEVAKLFCETNLIVLASFISPSRAIRSMARDIVGAEHFYEIFVNAPLELCEERDVKGLYQKARAGEIKNFTGISAPYEAPQQPDLTIHTGKESLSESRDKVLQFIQKKVHLS